MNEEKTESINNDFCNAKLDENSKPLTFEAIDHSVANCLNVVHSNEKEIIEYKHNSVSCEEVITTPAVNHIIPSEQEFIQKKIIEDAGLKIPSVMSQNEERITSRVEVNGFVKAKNFIQTEDFDSICNEILGINLDESTNAYRLEILNKDVSIKRLDIDENINISSKIEEVVKVTDKEEYFTTKSGRKEIEFFKKLDNFYSNLVEEEWLEFMKKNSVPRLILLDVLHYETTSEISTEISNLFKPTFVWNVVSSLNEKILSQEPIQYIDSIKENIFRLGDIIKRLKTEIKEIIQRIHKWPFGKTILSL
nr:uncharacterized protein LOC112211661 [Halyomorpha halys]